MPGRDIIVIGASAGGIEVLRRIISELPRGFPAGVFVAVHVAPDAPSFLPDILTRAGALPASHCTHGHPIKPAAICVAPPGHHLIVAQGQTRLGHGPEENGSRPSVDVLFRSAAVAYGPRVVSVVLSGNLDDGAAGVWAVKQRGGFAIVQDPATAPFPGMPSAALRAAACDAVLPVEEIAPRLMDVVRTPLVGVPAPPAPSPEMVREVQIAELNMAELEQGPPGNPSTFGCPECGGALWQLEEGELTRFRCRVGHAYSPEALVAQASNGDSALWAALRALEESESFCARLVERYRKKNPALAERFLRRIGQTRGHVAALAALLARDTGGSVKANGD